MPGYWGLGGAGRPGHPLGFELFCNKDSSPSGGLDPPGNGERLAGSACWVGASGALVRGSCLEAPGRFGRAQGWGGQWVDGGDLVRFVVLPAGFFVCERNHTGLVGLLVIRCKIPEFHACPSSSRPPLRGSTFLFNC